LQQINSQTATKQNSTGNVFDSINPNNSHKKAKTAPVLLPLLPLGQEIWKAYSTASKPTMGTVMRN